jgi:hypothetical protein
MFLPTITLVHRRKVRQFGRQEEHQIYNPSMIAKLYTLSWATIHVKLADLTCIVHEHDIVILFVAYNI